MTNEEIVLKRILNGLAVSKNTALAIIKQVIEGDRHKIYNEGHISGQKLILSTLKDVCKLNIGDMIHSKYGVIDEDLIPEEHIDNPYEKDNDMWLGDDYDE